MTPQELKASILQRAIQGKLVPQIPEEGTGEELYRQIQAEKQRLIKSGTIKKEKPLPEITEDEIPFDIPESWKWVCLLEIVEEKPSNGYSPKGVDYVTNIRNLTLTATTSGKFKNDAFKYVDISQEEASKYWLKHDDLLIQRSNSRELVGTSCIYTGNDNEYIYPDLMMRMRVCADMSVKYVDYVLKSPMVRSYYMLSASGTSESMPKINQNTVSCTLIPLPPLAEQKRIVAKIEELLPLIDRYEQAWSRLEDFNKRFPVDVQKSILQMAIQGKLVPQIPEEGTGEELYRQIQAEKQRLIKSGTIKKEKPLPEITEDEIPFDIPESWKWVRLQDIISVLGDGIHGTPIFDETGYYYFVNGNNLSKGNIVFKADTKKVSIDEYEKHKKPLDANTILISINGTIGNYAFYAGEPIILGKSACYFSVLSGIDKEYVRHLINTKFFMDYAVKEATQTTIKNVSLKAMRMFPVPLPPLGEQKRIVAKLEEILPLCERMK